MYPILGTHVHQLCGDILTVPHMLAGVGVLQCGQHYAQPA